MKIAKKDLEKLRKLKRSKHHPLIHEVHKNYKISKKTLFYIKEYGPHTNVQKTIIKESIKILLLASIISSFGGLTLEYIKPIFLSITPLIIMLPVLNDMIGNYGIISSSRFSTMLHERKIKKWWLNKDLRKLFIQILVISEATAILSSVIALVISSLSNYTISLHIVYKIFYISLIDVISLVSVLFLISILAGLYFYRKGEDPNNFLIPITTSIADFGNMLILSILIILFF